MATFSKTFRAYFFINSPWTVFSSAVDIQYILFSFAFFDYSAVSTRFFRCPIVRFFQFSPSFRSMEIKVSQRYSWSCRCTVVITGVCRYAMNVILSLYIRFAGTFIVGIKMFYIDIRTFPSNENGYIKPREPVSLIELFIA